MPLGLYISVPFCRTKCSFCNFSSGVFSRSLFDRYVEHLERELAGAEGIANAMGGRFEREVDSIYLGGGTPSVLAPDQLTRLFAAVRRNFHVHASAETTVECAPGTLQPELVETLLACGVNRVSLGVQSFIDRESSSVGRLHTRAITLADIERLRAAGISDISVDLIAGLPYQTKDSWADSLREAVATEVPHVSVYMLEVDEDSRLGRELIAGGTRYHAHHVPDEDLTADFYEQAVDTLNEAGISQYEISNFARTDSQSRHNLKYWTRQPYLGFGIDAHSMLPSACSTEPHSAVRFATVDNLDQLLAGAVCERTEVDENAAIEETFFLGLRLNCGVSLTEVRGKFGDHAVSRYGAVVTNLVEAKLVELQDEVLRLTPRGRLLSNNVFERFLCDRSPVQDGPGT